MAGMMASGWFDSKSLEGLMRETYEKRIDNINFNLNKMYILKPEVLIPWQSFYEGASK